MKVLFDALLWCQVILLSGRKKINVGERRDEKHQEMKGRKPNKRLNKMI